MWLAVTSLSFDISVLELLWTLCRGFKVVLQERRDRRRPAGPTPAADARPIDFSLFYFASDDARTARDRYRLLLEGARFADAHGFAAVWTPERHFHAFGGLYPNPAVTGAAIAAITERVEIRAGSRRAAAAPPDPRRRGVGASSTTSRTAASASRSPRAGSPTTSCWRPQNYARAKEVDVREPRRRAPPVAWRDASTFAGPDGRDVDVRTLPRPVQPELPVWITTAGNPETFRQAGEIGANVLTHLLGQTVEELAEKIRGLPRGAAGGRPRRSTVASR